MSTVVQRLVFIAIEGYKRNAAEVDRCDLTWTLRIGSRTFSPQAIATRDNSRAFTEVFMIDPEGEDIATLETVDDGADADADDVSGSATFSIPQAAQGNIDRLELPLYSTKSNKQQGVLTLSVTWIPNELASAKTSTTTSLSLPVTAPATAAPSCIAAAAATPTLSVAASATAAEPVATEQGGPSISPSLHLSIDPFGQALQPVRRAETDNDGPTGLLSGTTTAALLPSTFEAVATELSELASPHAVALAQAAEQPTLQPEAAPKSMMAAMVVVAAMVAGADLPTPPCAGSSVTCNEADSRGISVPSDSEVSGSASTATPAAAFYPRIKPYDAAPPLEFGAGLLPRASSDAAAFYPVIAVRLRLPDLSVRLHELRPTVSAPLPFGAA
ncbi:hypothetical protein Vretimale_11956 [Volvox reticuliferus]|uniref:Uncharacterized protein n=1 Tax=Volvox reticuliferus TaxID=1737510 RepID=A0A8J4LSV6_9CHLO|nr:hypothetical protein Vretifemale_11329 [Volvox reticuliferus]GIM07916.1 hypothetical protein Vretimale_11956 [Volvox reticuliferus]